MRRTKDEFLQDQINSNQSQIDQIQEKGYDDTGIRNDLAQEIVDREQGDKDLEDKILAEGDTRRVADEGLQSEIDTLAENLASLEIPDLDGYATEDYVDSAIDGIEFPETDLTGLATEEYVDGAVGAEADTRRVADEGLQQEVSTLADTVASLEIPSIDGLATEEYVDAGDKTLQDQIDTLENYDDSGIKQELADEIVAREEGDNELQTGLNREIIDRIKGDNELEAEITELALALESLLVQREHGQWKYVGYVIDNRPKPGEFALEDELSQSINYLAVNQTDIEGKFHGWGDISIGDYVEVVDLDNPENYALYVITDEPDGTGFTWFEVKLKDKGNNFLIGETCEIRFFQVNQEDLQLEDLDRRYLKKAGGDNMEGPLHVKGHSGDSRGTSRIKTLGVFSESNSALRLGTKTDRIYIEDENTKFNGGVLVNNIGPKTEDGRGVTLNVEGNNDKHLVTKKYVDTAVGSIEIPETDLSGYLPLDGSKVMTGNLTAPRVNIKTTDFDEGVLLVEGKRDNVNTVAARMTFSNSYNENAYGSLSWKGTDGQGWFEFNKDVDMARNGLHSVSRIRLLGDKSICDGNTSRITVGGNVEVQRAGSAKDGFTVLGRVGSNNSAKLLHTYHNSNADDAVNYLGKQEADNNIATVGYVKNQIGKIEIPEVGEAKGSLVSYKARMVYQANGNNDNQFYFTDVNGAATTGQAYSKFFLWKIPASCWVKSLTQNGVRNLGEVLIYNTTGTIMWTGSIITVEDPSRNTKIKIDTDRHYGSNAWNNGSIYMVELVMAFREK
jgi:hypothetical protein